MNYLKAIKAHQLGQEYSEKALQEFVNGYISQEIDDKLMTLFIKSIYEYGLSNNRLAYLTKIMIDSGKTIDLSSLDGIIVDKHSTGGVGDKVSLILGPILASLGLIFAKMSGAGLGFTGGTLDKLAAIPGFNTNLNETQFKEILKQHRIAIIGQSQDLVPADQKIYALRDITGYVDSIPLIASSVISKKIATGANIILLDIKCGDGAFMKNQEDAILLAKTMIEISKYLHKDVRAEITNMNSPLGKAIGNKNEVLEALKFLQNEFISDDLKEVIYSAATTILMQAKIFSNEMEAQEAIDQVLKSKKALTKFKEWITAQGGDFEALTKKDYWRPLYKKEIYAVKEGYLAITSAIVFGKIAVSLGAGRAYKGQKIDHDAGIMLNYKHGSKIAKGDLLFTLYSSKLIAQEIINQIDLAYELRTSVDKRSTILAKIK